jgi:glycosyltransferase involved in cell wall biosynthesis
MRVLHIIPNLQKGGAERLCLDIVRGLKQVNGIEVRLATLNDIHEYQQEYPEIRIDILNSYIKPSISKKWQINLDSYNKLISEFKPDIIHTHLFEADFAAHYQINKSAKYITHFHDNMHQLSVLKLKDLNSKKRITELYERNYIVKKYKEVNNHFIAISADTQKYLHQTIPRSLKKNIHLIPNAIDTAVFRKSEKKKPTKDLFRLINIGSFVAKKNQMFLVDLAVELIKRDFPFELVLVGDGMLKKQVFEYAKEKQCINFIRFTGKVANVCDLLDISDIYVHSATYEPFGLALLEAMAAGLPVVCLDGRGNRDIIVQGKNGYAIQKNDTILFANAIEKLAKDKNMYQEMSAYASTYSAQYDIHPYCLKLVDLYQSIL